MGEWSKDGTGGPVGLPLGEPPGWSAAEGSRTTVTVPVGFSYTTKHRVTYTMV